MKLMIYHNGGGIDYTLTRMNDPNTETFDNFKDVIENIINEYNSIINPNLNFHHIYGTYDFSIYPMGYSNRFNRNIYQILRHRNEDGTNCSPRHAGWVLDIDNEV